MSWGNNDKGFSFALSAWFIVASVTGCLWCCSNTEVLLNALVVGYGSYTLWSLVALTLGYDTLDEYN